jgi:hypothetical protein
MPQVAQELNEQGSESPRQSRWTPRAVRDVLRNGIYTGKYAIAGVERQIEEYRIIEESTFEKATATRHRFQTGSTNRVRMPEGRKAMLVDGVLEQYSSFCGTG